MRPLNHQELSLGWEEVWVSGDLDLNPRSPVISSSPHFEIRLGGLGGSFHL